MKLSQMPAVLKRALDDKENEIPGFPLKHYSYSSFTKFSTNPFMFKVNNINGEYLESTSSAANILGKAMHHAMRAYLGGDPKIPTPANEGEAIIHAKEEGWKKLISVPDGFIEYNTVIENRSELEEKYLYTFFEYIKDCAHYRKVELLIVEKRLRHKIEVEGKILPVPLESYPDVVYRDEKKRIIIDDHKFTSKYSDKDAIDAEKLVQAVFNYFLVFAELGEAPYSIKFREFKTVPNKDKSPQTREFEMVYEETPLMFDFFFRLYKDITDGIMGKMVYIPNFSAFYDKEVAVLAYIHHLDIEEERAKRFKEMKVENITDFLKKKIQKDGSMKKYLEVVAQKFISGSTLNYKDMKPQDRIKMKLAEHGIATEYQDQIVGGAVTLFRYEASVGVKMSRIEAYAKDIEQAVGVKGVRILAPIPNSELIGFEVPNKTRIFPKAIPSTEGFDIAIGVDVMGNTKNIDIREAPHLLVAGTTGSGKSVFLNTIIKQLMKKKSTEIILIDPKMVELSQFEGGKNVREYADDPAKILKILNNLNKEMNERYATLKKAKLRSIMEGSATMKMPPYIFLIIDEFGDLVSSSKYGQDIRHALLILAQKGRAAGIHIIVTTQHPTVKIIDSEIKANFPTRVAFKTAVSINSQVIIDENGADKLLGRGDMLLKTHDSITRLQGYNDK